MELSVVVAKILGLVYLAAGIAALRGTLTFSRMVEDFERSPALTYVTGFLTLTLGVLLVQYHNLWVADWRILITLVAWAALIKGFILIAFPGVIARANPCCKNPRGCGILLLAMGVLFCYFGFLG